MLELIYPPCPKTVLVIAAHPDDLEYSLAGTIAKWASKGSKVVYSICTAGESGTHELDISQKELSERRKSEQIAAANILGVNEVVFLDYHDGYVEASFELRKDLTALIRQYRPNAVMTWDPTQYYFGTHSINHPDHIAVGQATLAAIMPSCDSPFIFPELLRDERLKLHKVHEVYLYGTTDENVYVDISSFINKKINAIKCHKTQVRNPTRMEKNVRETARKKGELINKKYAEGFKYYYLK